MRLWHQELITHLPKEQVRGQWRECIALLGKGWGRKHRTVDYVFTHTDDYLIRYSNIVYKEMIVRGFKANYSKIEEALLRRYKLNNIKLQCKINSGKINSRDTRRLIYSEHNEDYLQECILNLKSKGIIIKI